MLCTASLRLSVSHEQFSAVLRGSVAFYEKGLVVKSDVALVRLVSCW